MSATTVRIIAGKELRDALHNRWFLLDAGAFVVLALAMSYLGMAGADLRGVAGFGRTAAALTSVVLLIVPLMGLSVGALSLSGERERGTLTTLLVQPLSRLELFVGKWCGLAAAMAIAVGVGFGFSGLMIATLGAGDGVAAYLALAGLAFLLALAGLAIGMLISATSQRTAVAIGTAIGAWLTLVFVGDLGILGAGLAMHLGDGQLLALSLINPLTDFRVAAILVAGASPEVLGPSGLVLKHTFGALDVAALVGVLTLWCVAPLAISYRLLRGRDLA